jgi:hypothetical protein
MITFRPGFGAGDILGAMLATVVLTVVLLLAESHLVVALEWLRLEREDINAVSAWARKGDAQAAANRMHSAVEFHEMARNSLKFVLLLVPVVGIGIALASIAPLRSLAHRIGLIRSKAAKALRKPPDRGLRIYLRLLMVSQVLAIALYALIVLLAISD